MKQQISRFDGPHFFLSNFYPAEVLYQGAMYPSSEHAYQAAKTDDPELRRPFQDPSLPAGKAKKMGRKLKLCDDWEVRKLGVMGLLLEDKFWRHEDLRRKLLDTGDADLVEGNNWGDRFWGVDGAGENWLGRMLMLLRWHLRERESRP